MRSNEDFIHLATEDARSIMESSAAVRSLVACDIIARKLFVLLRVEIEEQIRRGWDVSNPDLVIQTLAMAAQAEAGKGTTVAETKREVLETLFPVLDILDQQETAIESDLLGKQEARNEDPS